MAFPSPNPISNLDDALNNAHYDSLIIIADDFSKIKNEALVQATTQLSAIDARVGNQVVVTICEFVPGKRLILVPTGNLNRDYDDVRRYFDATKKAINEAKASGSINPVIFLADKPSSELYEHALTVSYLGACQALWQPLEAREHFGESIEPVQTIGLVGATQQVCDYASAISAGQYAARDLCGTEPERMAPPRFAQYCEALFVDSNVAVEVISDFDVIK